ncbi:hypothetical protein [Azospirillum sp.]|uniref:hypothetical protein n=1 Tax=Azospirillum sp. TaxID=34012 RepID=UPI003D70E903
MPITNDRELERAVAEFQRLNETPADSPEARRRRELDADIKDYYQRCSNEMRPGRPVSDPEGD